MALITRPTKSSGGTSYADGNVLPASDLNNESDTIYNDYNGNVTNANVAAGADIAQTKIGDISAAAANHRQTSDPGDTTANNLPTTLQAEIQQLRYQLQKLGIGTNASRTNGGAVGWYDRPPRGENLIRNGSFATYAQGSDTPDGWTKSGTPTLTTTAEVTLTSGVALSIEATGATEGVEQTLSGLKASTRYLVGVNLIVSAGTFHLQTTGALSGTFSDLDLTSTSATATVVSGIVSTDTTPTDIVVKLMAEDGSTVLVMDAFCLECSSNPQAQLAASTGTTSFALFTDLARIDSTGFTTVRSSGATDLAVVMTKPRHGLLCRVSGSVQVQANAALELRLRIVDQIGTVHAEVGVTLANAEIRSVVIPPVLIVSDTALAATSTFTIEGRTSASTCDVNDTSGVTGATVQSWLTGEWVVQS